MKLGIQPFREQVSRLVLGANPVKRQDVPVLFGEQQEVPVLHVDVLGARSNPKLLANGKGSSIVLEDRAVNANVRCVEIDACV